MSYKILYTGFAIAVAWPETYCKQPGYWYDGVSGFLGLSKNNYYKVGHAALVLVDSNSKKCHYFDFGRYHTPFKHGRVRSEITDHGLTITSKPVLSGNHEEIENFHEIVTELQQNAECHGEGAMYASYCRINFQKAFKKANALQQLSPIPYGPFKYKGSNCSRFVNTSIIAGNPNWKFSFKLKYFVPLTPTPLNNVNALSHQKVLPKMLLHDSFYPGKITDKGFLKRTLPQPKRNTNIPEASQWHRGEGAGSWFHIDLNKNKYIITRYSKDGVLECKGKFTSKENAVLNLNLAFELKYLSHCDQVTIQQNNRSIELVKETGALD